MIILHELNQLETGGAERVVAGIAKHDVENKHTVYAWKDGPMRKVFVDIGVEVIIDENGKTPNVDADLIHIHTGGDASQMASAVKGLYPTVETVHCPVVSAVKDKWVHQRVGVSETVSRMNRNCLTIYNGVDLDRIDEDKESDLREFLEIPRGAFVIGRLGRVGTDKNVEEFLVACWNFQRQVPEANSHVLVVGDEAKTSRGYMAKVKVMAASFPLRNVHFLPSLENVGLAYRTMNAFLYPSESEAFGMVWVEAMAAGVPVVTWQTPVAVEMLMGSAYLSPKKNIEGLVQGLKIMYSNPGIAQEFSSLGSDHARGYFSSELMSQNYQKLYKEVLERNLVIA